MEVVRLVDSVLTKVESVRKMIKDDKKARFDLQMALEGIKWDMALMSSKVNEICSEKAEKPVQWILQLQELAYEIEDFIERRARDPQTSAPIRLLHVAMVMDPLPEHMALIQRFQSRIDKIQIAWKEHESSRTMLPTSTQEDGGKSGYGRAVSGPSAGSGAAGSSSASFSSCHHKYLGTGKRDLLELLLGDDGEQKELKVISILGCSGSGKTTLAWAVHEDRSVVERFSRRAFVDVSVFKQPSEILHSIHQQVRRGAVPWSRQTTSSSSIELTKDDLREFLRDKRYLVIIDGVQIPQDWSNIVAAFPSNEESSRVVVCTSFQSVATACSFGSYRYKLQALNRIESEDLFWGKLGGENRSPVLEIGLKTLFDKCEGLPEALIRAAEFLSQYGAALTEERCKKVGVALGNHIASDPEFREMKRALGRCYDSLSDQGHKSCMLSVGMFPRGHRISRKSLVRRWNAEGLLVGDIHLTEDDVAVGCLDKLVDLGVIDPVLLGDNSQVKRYKVYGVMLEFIVHRSVSWNFLTLLHDDRVVRNDTTCAPRRLSVHGIGGTAKQMDELSRIRSSIRSLTICDSKEMDFKFDECMLLRVLDLEGCTWLEAAHLDTIRKLLYLKYLNLRGTQVSQLPRKMEDLHCLETLDARDTHVEILPMEVLMLPQLVHLFGEFELPAELGDGRRKEKLMNFFSKESKLHTLAGFKIVKNRGFETILLHCKPLRKVKIWCKIPPPRRPSSKLACCFKIKDVPILSESLVSSLADRYSGLDSLSIDFNGICNNFLDYVITASSGPSSVKISGEMESLPSSTLSMLVHSTLRKLHLSKTGLSSKELSRLQNLELLVCLRLTEDRHGPWDDDSFLVEPNKFQSLQQICFQGPKLPSVQIANGAMPCLISLQLLCPEPEEGLGVTGITHLQKLNEVLLHPDVSEKKMQKWKAAAVQHKNRPYVQKQLSSNEHE